MDETLTLLQKISVVVKD
jgi:hypothetical protein